MDEQPADQTEEFHRLERAVMKVFLRIESRVVELQRGVPGYSPAAGKDPEFQVGFRKGQHCGLKEALDILQQEFLPRNQ